MTTTTPPGLAGLAERAVHAARVHHAADPTGFHRRHNSPDGWNQWARRARVTRTIAAALQVPADAVLITDDPHRTYRTRTGEVPGDLITVTDPTTARAWRFIPDHTTPGDGWLLLNRCPECGAEIPATRIATLADLGDYLDPDGDIWPADEARDKPLHQPGCALALPALTTPGDQAMTPHPVPDIKTVVRRFTENDCQITAIVADPTDAQQTLYGIVTHHGQLVGSYYCADPVHQTDWRIVTALGYPLSLDRRPVKAGSEGAAVTVLTTILTARDSFEVEQRLQDASRRLGR